MHNQADEELVQQTLKGSIEAFDRLVRRYIDAVYGLALSRTQDVHQAQDLTQESFIEAYVSLPHLRDCTKFPHWLFGITSNLCSRWLVRRRRMLSLDELGEESLHAPSQSSRPDENYARKEIREIVQESIWALPDKAREAVILFYIDGYSYNDLAAFFGVSIGTIRSRLRYGREKMKGGLMGMVEEELKMSKPGSGFSNRITDQVEHLWQRLLEVLPADLLKVVSMSKEEITRHNQELFGSLEQSLSAKQRARMEEQGHLEVEDLTAEQQDMLREGAHFMWAYHLLQPPPFIKDLASFNVKFGNYDCPDIPRSHGKRFVAIFKPNPDGGQVWYQSAMEM